MTKKTGIRIHQEAFEGLLQFARAIKTIQMIGKVYDADGLTNQRTQITVYTDPSRGEKDFALRIIRPDGEVYYYAIENWKEEFGIFNRHESVIPNQLGTEEQDAKARELSRRYKIEFDPTMWYLESRWVESDHRMLIGCVAGLTFGVEENGCAHS